MGNFKREQTGMPCCVEPMLEHPNTCETNIASNGDGSASWEYWGSEAQQDLSPYLLLHCTYCLRATLPDHQLYLFSVFSPRLLLTQVLDHSLCALSFSIDASGFYFPPVMSFFLPYSSYHLTVSFHIYFSLKPQQVDPNSTKCLESKPGVDCEADASKLHAANKLCSCQLPISCDILDKPYWTKFKCLRSFCIKMQMFIYYGILCNISEETWLI